uniref:Ig-like domain-containing protein n=1 Tax=Gasterosteus aculeatus aculeatus TaxID=481459 RepID=A0AAQ4R2I4_GASAC
FNGEYCITVREGEIAAEAGLCVVIPCSFTTAASFTPEHLLWYKCEPLGRRCDDSDVIFHSNKRSKKVQAGFMGRVSLLEPDVRLKICSIIINDLTESDAGSYQLRVNGVYYGRENGFTFFQKVTISKPTVGIPPLTAGQQTTLSCTAPGLCSGSDPEITWTWRGAGEKDSHITGNITAVKTEHLTSVTQRHVSTLTFKPSAEHRSTDVTCKVRFTNDVTTEETVTLNYNMALFIIFFTDVRSPVITGSTTVVKGAALNLTCGVESFPPSRITWATFGSGTTLERGLDVETGLNVHAHTSRGDLLCETWDSACALSGPPRFLSRSRCEVRSEVLTCVCVSEGLLLPSITWPLLKNHSEYSVVTTVSGHTVHSTLTLRDHVGTSIECVSSNDHGEAKENLKIQQNTPGKEGECSQ